MFASFLLVLILFRLSNAASTSVPACKLTAPDCLDKISVKAFSKCIKGDPELKMDTLDPMHQERITIKLAVLHAEFTDTTITGFADCKMQNVSLNTELILSSMLRCPHMTMSGKYNIGGKLITLPVEGTGDYRIDLNEFKVSIDAFLKVVTGADGKSHVMIKDYKMNFEPLGRITYDFKNLFNGNKELADVVEKYANENWRLVADATDAQVLRANFNKIIKNTNKYYKTIPIEI